MKNKTAHFPSSDGINQIFVRYLIPDGKIKGILQIAHGMTEYCDRYLPFMNYMAKHGFLTITNDHLGHGNSVKSSDDLGYFYHEDSDKYIVKDLHRITRHMKNLYPDIPYIILGHSMGSFLTREYLSKHSNDVDAALLLGTGNHSLPAMIAAKYIVKFLTKIHGDRYRSPFIQKMIFGVYNQHFSPVNTDFDWVCSDEKIASAFSEDELCNFNFTLSGYATLVCVLTYITKKSNINKIRKDLPICFLAGLDDPVGNYGKGVISVANAYQKAGIKDVTLKLYPGDRHEILNETNKDDVMTDILHWLEKVLSV